MKCPLSILFLATAISALTARDVQSYRTQKFIPGQLATGPATANLVSSQFGLDSSQISAVNDTTWDWWYFDAQSPDLKTAITIIFFTSYTYGFPGSSSDTEHVTTVSTFFQFANGTATNINIPADGATITTVGQGSSGVFNGTGASWEGTSDMSKYQIAIDSPENGLKGTFVLRSTAPAHYPCGPVEKGQTMKVAPAIGWANAVPDAVGEIDFKVSGSEFKFTGVAYHDKNWSNEPFIRNVQSWYWGHGRMGPYSLVWFDTIGGNGKEYLSSYAVENGKVLSSSCTASAIKVRPVGSPYPPKLNDTNQPIGYTIVMDLGSEGTLTVNLTTATKLIDHPTYHRWAGSMSGSLNGGKVYNGTALYEQFTLV